jgi:putative ATP-dependent endonuclease of the OLD family
MRITSITAKNYRTLEDINLRFAKNYCTISGRNNAGKSCVIRLLSALFRVKPSYVWGAEDRNFDYKEDKTQWVKQPAQIQIEYSLELTQQEETALISFVERIASTKIDKPAIPLRISYNITDADALSVGASVGDHTADGQAAKDIEKRIRDSNLLFLYNSTTPHEEYYLVHGRRKMFYDFVMSEEEKKGTRRGGKAKRAQIQTTREGAHPGP